MTATDHYRAVRRTLIDAARVSNMLDTPPAKAPDVLDANALDDIDALAYTLTRPERTTQQMLTTDDLTLPAGVDVMRIPAYLQAYMDWPSPLPVPGPIADAIVQIEAIEAKRASNACRAAPRPALARLLADDGLGLLDDHIMSTWLAGQARPHLARYRQDAHTALKVASTAAYIDLLAAVNDRMRVVAEEAADADLSLADTEADLVAKMTNAHRQEVHRATRLAAELHAIDRAIIALHPRVRDERNVSIVALHAAINIDSTTYTRWEAWSEATFTIRGRRTDAPLLAELHRAGDLFTIGVPATSEEHHRRIEVVTSARQAHRQIEQRGS